ncbi:MAG: NAD(+)/NADH kinase [Chloroflexi bacterium]|nr:NAD(+)/NADH kinase [Chloroflexota bacterium]
MIKRIGVLFHPKVPASRALADRIAEDLTRLGARHWVVSAWEEAEAHALIPETDLVLTLGGDGTILRAARIVVPHEVPILAVNMGKLGFLAEVAPGEVLGALPSVLAGAGWIEERMMLSARLLPATGGLTLEPFQALNDVVVGRGALARIIYIHAFVNGEPFTTYAADGLVVATPTGSTGYSLAAGGPILHPELRAFLLSPIAPYLSLSRSVELPGDAEVTLDVRTDHQASLSIDGQLDLALRNNDRVVVRQSPHVTRFLRLGSRSYFFATLAQRLRQEVRPCWLSSTSPTLPSSTG